MSSLRLKKRRKGNINVNVTYTNNNALFHHLLPVNAELQIFSRIIFWQDYNDQEVEEVTGKTAKLLFHMASKTRARKRVPSAT